MQMNEELGSAGQQPSPTERRPSRPPASPGSRGYKDKLPGLMFGLGIALCALCCTTPLLVGIGVGGAALVAFGATFEKAGLLLVALGALGLIRAIVRRRRARAASCSTDCACGSRPEVA